MSLCSLCILSTFLVEFARPVIHRNSPPSVNSIKHRRNSLAGIAVSIFRLPTSV